MSRGQRGILSLVSRFAAGIVVLAVLSTILAIVRHGLVLMVVLVPLTAAAFLAGRWYGLRALRGRSRELPERLAEELAWYRRSLAELEEAAGRPLSLIIASYRRVGRSYQAPERRS